MAQQDQPSEAVPSASGDESLSNPEEDGQYFWQVTEDPQAAVEWTARTLDESLPLLDLNVLWSNVLAKKEESEIETSTRELCTELSHYFWVPHVLKKKKGALDHWEALESQREEWKCRDEDGESEQTKTSGDITEPMKTNQEAYEPQKSIDDSEKPSQDFGAGAKLVEQEISEEKSENEEQVKGKEDADQFSDEYDPEVKSIFGEPLMFKLRYENKKPKKKVAQKTFDEQAAFIGSVYSQIITIKEKNGALFPVFLSSFALELTPHFFADLLQALEVESVSLASECRKILQLMADHVNPKEMHLAIRMSVSKIDASNLEGSSYYLLPDLIEIWSRVVRRIMKKRTPFLLDLMKIYDRMLPLCESFASSHGSTSDASNDPNSPEWRVPDVLISLISRLLEVQKAQWNSSDILKGIIDENGELRKDRVVTVKYSCKSTEFVNATEEDLSYRNPGRALGDKLESRGIEDSMIDDWLLERRMLLCYLLDLTKSLVNRLPDPPGERQRIPKHVQKSKAEKKAVVKALEIFGRRCDALRALFCELGWSNPVRACQIASVALRLEHIDRETDILHRGIGPFVRFSKNSKDTMLSVAVVACYLFVALRAKSSSSLDSTAFTLQGSAFDYLEPMHALDTALSYVMTMAGSTSIAVTMGGVFLAREFLTRIKKKWSFEEVVRLRGACPALGHDVSIEGLIYLLGKSVSRIDDPMHRETAYQTLRSFLGNIESPMARFGVARTLLLNSDRLAVAAQFVTELKDAIIYSDFEARNSQKSWSPVDANSLRTQFAELVFPRYLTPRKDYLSRVNPIVASSVAAMFLAISDGNTLSAIRKSNDDPAVSKAEAHQAILSELGARQTFVKQYVELGIECVRALAAAAEHDRKSVPKSQLAKKDLSNAKALFAASGRTLNNCISALSSLDHALERLNRSIELEKMWTKGEK